MEKKKKKNFKSWFFVLPLIILNLFISCFGFTSSLVASADLVTGYSSPLSDLMKDENFVKEDYPQDKADKSLKVIQVAESVDKELFIYVYQPAEMFIATSINMSLEKHEMSNNKIYYLSYIGRNETFYKYRVNDLQVSDAEVRHYNIVSIFRPYYSNIDVDVTDKNITEIAFPVATCFSIATNDDGSYSYSNSGTETIEITTKFTSFIRYDNGSTLFPYEHDSFFVAFDTDRDIEKLMEADISFVYYTYDCYKDLLGNDEGVQVASLPIGHYSDYGTHNHSEKVTENKLLNYESTEKISLGKIFKQKYSWSQIESVGAFINDDDKELTTEALENLANKKWVLNFHHAEFEKGTEYLMASPVKNYESGTIVEDVTILRLKFETEGVTYNLGVIDNKQDSTIEPSGSGYSWREKLKDNLKDFWDKSKWVFISIAIIIVLILIGIFTPVFKLIWKCFVFLMKLLWLLISAPFVFIKSKIKKE